MWDTNIYIFLQSTTYDKSNSMTPHVDGTIIAMDLVKIVEISIFPTPTPPPVLMNVHVSAYFQVPNRANFRPTI